jgi:hypothetical protein
MGRQNIAPGTRVQTELTPSSRLSYGAHARAECACGQGRIKGMLAPCSPPMLHAHIAYTFGANLHMHALHTHNLHMHAPYMQILHLLTPLDTRRGSHGAQTALQPPKGGWPAELSLTIVRPQR